MVWIWSTPKVACICDRASGEPGSSQDSVITIDRNEIIHLVGQSKSLDNLVAVAIEYRSKKPAAAYLMEYPSWHDLLGFPVLYGTVKQYSNTTFTMFGVWTLDPVCDKRGEETRFMQISPATVDQSARYANFFSQMGEKVVASP